MHWAIIRAHTLAHGVGCGFLFFIHVTSFNFEEFRKDIFRVFCVCAKLSCHIFDAQCPVFYNLYKVLHGEL